jgi:crotonobetainyl-CoA:carnitine CoA-transferase CaiB-like acyl-CoA transferase
VVDLTTHWAGPLCTALLAAAGAQVFKVEPDCRPDGFRAHPAVYEHLNHNKVHCGLDLRQYDDREAFERLVRSADLVIWSFGRRVMPNFGYGPADLRRINPEVATAAIVAFPAGSPEQDWIAYGSGVHAASGLGLVNGAPTPASISYPDPLAGLVAFVQTVDLLSRIGPSLHAEIALADVVRPLLASDVGGRR